MMLRHLVNAVEKIHLELYLNLDRLNILILEAKNIVGETIGTYLMLRRDFLSITSGEIRRKKTEKFDH